MKPVLLVSAILLVVGCRPVTRTYVPTPPPKVAPVSTEVTDARTLMPLDVGNQWTYDMQTEVYQANKLVGRGEETVTYTVKGRYGLDKRDAYVVLESKGKPVDVQDWRATPEGLYQLTAGLKRTPYSVPQPLILLPIRKGSRFEWRGKGVMSNGVLAPGDLQGEILEPQVVDTGMGPLSAIPVLTRLRFTGGTSENTSWFRPNVGLVRYRQATTTGKQRVVVTLTLSNYALTRS